ncbi:uncharacterized protein LOC126905023 [Daktulosphaira vitifoliae]|uniref:uncharacterized protein LOC126905023 n=1 Tax=Daktulosphaira vitifoliae TaxID=58002 RepID=UPI0021AB0288|nr:uncharacterized protein LOC126905023 [Daktulosphaira vitifoliae]
MQSRPNPVGGDQHHLPLRRRSTLQSSNPQISMDNSRYSGKNNQGSKSPISPLHKKPKSDVIVVTSPGSPTSNINSLYVDSPNISTVRQPNVPECFPLHYTGPLNVLVSASGDNNLGNFHPVKLGKTFSKLFPGILSINPIGSKRVKITFESVNNANNCLTSPSLSEHGYSANIPSTLLYSIGIIRLDKSISEEDFWEGYECSVKVISFRLINIKKDNILVSSNLVELKFLSATLPQKLSIYKVIFDVSPSIRSPVQCRKCLRFGHTLKFCRSKERCSHCGLFDHTESNCNVKLTTPPSCIFCKLNHLATDRSCSEWSVQKDIKKIMATNNVSFSEASSIKRSSLVNKAFNFSDVAKNTNISSVEVVASPSFPSLSHSTNTYTNKQKKKKSNKTQVPSPHFPPLPNDCSRPISPNGSFLKYMSQNRSTNVDDRNWISCLSQHIVQLLASDPNLISSPSILQSTIESSLTNIHYPLSDNDDTF